ncbi:hypothetical protein BDZ94DRAFT_584739 [Collybia nuda]|uniref:Uncharacterized protein n=1 Tax=Collybia nuda TaxID=64659 RepID=A0A9P5XU34_9AGAR|nr:hypothetical protein BDZ94DRAFT_584739 [Collybia nuda]
MAETPRPSWFKRQLHKLKDKTLRGRSHERPTTTQFGRPDLPHCPSPTAREVLLEFSGHPGISEIPRAWRKQLWRDWFLQLPHLLTHTQTESRLAHNVKLAAKGTLWALSTAAKDLPIPGAKAIFDSIRKIIDVVEQTKKDFRALRHGAGSS